MCPTSSTSSTLSDHSVLINPSFLDTLQSNYQPNLETSKLYSTTLPVTQYDNPTRIHFTTCSIETYFDLLEENENQYDLVDGLLVEREMGDELHERIAEYMFTRLQYYAAEERSDLCVHKEATIYIEKSSSISNKASSRESATNRSRSYSNNHQYDYTIRKADLAVGIKEDCEAPHPTHSPSSRMIKFSEDKQAPFMVMEITSTSKTRRDDLYSKKNQHLNRGIKEYVIVDRDKDRRHSDKWNPSVIVYILKYHQADSGSSSDQSIARIEEHRFHPGNSKQPGKVIAVEDSIIGKFNFRAEDIFNCQSAADWLQSTIKIQKRELTAKSKSLEDKEQTVQKLLSQNAALTQLVKEMQSKRTRDKTTAESEVISRPNSGETVNNKAKECLRRRTESPEKKKSKSSQERKK